jgi:hypothetical protein
MQTLEGKSEDLSLQIANKEAKIDELTIAYTEKERQAQLDLSLRMKEQTETVVLEYLNANQKTAIPTTELNGLRSELEKLKADFTKEVNSQVGKAEAISKNHYEQALKLKDAEFSAKEATNTAENKSLQNRVAFLEDQVEMWKGQLEAERDASVQRAKASSVGAINVAPSGGR